MKKFISIVLSCFFIAKSLEAQPVKLTFDLGKDGGARLSGIIWVNDRGDQSFLSKQSQ